MRVLSLAWECPVSPYGGLGTFVSRLLPEMAGEGHEVAHYCLHGSTPPLHPVDYHGVKVVRVREPLVSSGSSVAGLTAVAFAGEVLNLLPLFDLVVAHDFHTSPAVVASYELGVPSVFYVHMWTYTALDAAGVAYSTAACANSRLTKGELLKVVNRPDIKVVYPASPYKPVGEMPVKKNARPMVVIPSRLQENKSPGIVMGVLEKVRSRVPFSLVVFGRGSEHYPLPPWVIKRGTVSEEEKARLYSAADLVLQVGFPEPFGLVALEAVALGSPVLASSMSGVSEVLPSEAVYSLDDLEEKLVQYLSDPKAREELWARERRSWIMERTWRDVWREMSEEAKKARAQA
jgi:glycogen synthase